MTRLSHAQPLAFEDLIHQLDMRTRPEDQKRFLAWWLADAPEALRLTLAILLGNPSGQRVTMPALKKALFDRVNQELFEASKEAGTDLSETLALLWPGGKDGFDAAVLFAALESPSGKERTESVTALLDRSNALTRDLAIRIATGRYKSPVSSDIVRSAIADVFDKPLPDVEQNLANSGERTDIFSNWLTGEGFPVALTARTGFVALPGIRTCEPDEITNYDLAIPLPQGDFVQAVARKNKCRLYSPSGDLLEELEDGTEVPRQSTLLAFKPTRPGAPFIVLDLLMTDGEDLRGLSFRSRRDTLTDLADQGSIKVDIFTAPEPVPDPVSLTKVFEDPSVDRLFFLNSAATPGPSSPAYGQIERPPHDFHLKILYAEGRLSRQGAFDGVVTLGATKPVAKGTNIAELVPVGKADVDPLSPQDRTSLEHYIAENTLERFGPVRKLAATDETSLIARVACRSIEPASRRKAGIVLKEARVIELCDTSSAVGISTLDELTALALL